MVGWNKKFPNFHPMTRRKKILPVTKVSFSSKFPTKNFIQKYHSLNEKKESIRKTSVSSHQKKLAIESVDDELEKMGGIRAYQRASLAGSKLFNTASWLVNKLPPDQTSHQKYTLLDVGAVDLSYKKYKNIQAEYIDLHPQNTQILKGDFILFDFSNRKFHIVCLSLVLNFVGCESKRGEMIKKANQLLDEDSGFLYIVLPVECMFASTCTTHSEFLAQMSEIFNLSLYSFDTSKRLCFYLFQKNTSTSRSFDLCFATTKFKKNNFQIKF